MRRRPLGLVVALLVAEAVSEGLYPWPKSAVTSYTKDSELPSEKDGVTVVEFYAAWCGHCQHYAPTYEKIAFEARKSYPWLKVAAVNCADHSDICSKYSVSSYPTIVLFGGHQAEKRLASKEHSESEVIRLAKERHVADAASASTPEAGAAAHAEPLVLHAAAEHVPHSKPDSKNDAATGAAQLAAKPAPGEPAALSASTPKDEMSIPKVGSAALIAARVAQMQREAKQPPQPPSPPAVITVEQFDSGVPHLRFRPMPRPVPTSDVLAAARYTLFHDIAASLATAPPEGHARTKLGALRSWLTVLHRALPRGADGGGAAAGAAELLTLLGSRTKLPEPTEWKTMLSRSGAVSWTQEWSACNSSQPQLHAYPCSLWLLFHSLLAHSTEPDAIPTLHAIVSYVTNFFGCKECVGHFAVLAASLEQELREMAPVHHGGRDRASLWLWQAHNKVNERLATEEAEDGPAAAFHEYAKAQWPARSVCPQCRQMSRPQPGAVAKFQWSHDEVLRVMLEHYCLEPRFECWEAMALHGQRKPAAEISATYGSLALGAIILLLLCYACCGRSQPPCNSQPRAGGKGGGRRKVDHVV